MHQLILNIGALVVVGVASVTKFGVLPGLGITAAVFLLMPYNKQ